MKRLTAPLALALTAAALVFAAFVLANGPDARVDFPLDDAWIHQVYARALLRDGFPSYNPGVPEAGFSSPAWLLALAPTHAVRVLFATLHVGAVKLVTLAFACCAAWGLARVAARLAPVGRERAWAARAAALLPFASPGFAFAAVSGMEVALTSAAIAWTLAWALDARWRRVALGAALLPLCRPEASLVVVAVCAWAILHETTTQARARRALTLLVPPLVTGGAWLAWNLAVTGRPLPNTFYAKHATGALATRAAYFVDQVALAPGVLAACLTGALALCGAASAWRDPARRRALWLCLGATIAPLAGIVATHGVHRGVLFYEQRYFLPFTVLDAALVAPGIAWVASRLANYLRPALAAALVTVVCAGAAAPAWLASRSSYARHCADIYALHTRPALDARAATAPDTTLAVEGAGAARYFSDRRVVDLLGLNDHDLIGLGEYTRMCRILEVERGVFLIPSDWLPAFAPFYNARVLRAYSVAQWSVVRSHPQRTVLAVEMRARPDALAWRRGRLARGCHSRRGAP